MFRNILIPVAFDHKERAGKAIAVARKLADDGARIILLHVLDDIPAFITAQIPRDIVAESETTATQELEETAKAAGPDVKVSVVHGHASREILDYATDNDVDCIVISSHRPGLEDYFLGSTAARVVRHAACSVHVVR